ncbi:hypothetical protein EMIT0158MI4_90048 [Burkholderia ambifaria]
MLIIDYFVLINYDGDMVELTWINALTR